MDEEPKYLLLRTSNDITGKDEVHALRPMEGATEYLKDPATYACDNDTISYGRRGRTIEHPREVTCEECKVAIARG